MRGRKSIKIAPQCNNEMITRIVLSAIKKKQKKKKEIENGPRFRFDCDLRTVIDPKQKTKKQQVSDKMLKLKQNGKASSDRFDWHQ